MLSIYRPVRRFIEKDMVTALSMRVLAGEIPDNSSVTVGVRDRGLAYSCSAEDTSAMDAD